MYRTILAAVDASPRAPSVVVAALAVAHRFEGTVHLFRMVTLPPEFPPAAHAAPDHLEGALVDEARQQLVALGGGDARVVVERPELGVAEPWRAILERARQLGADLIVIGSHGYGGWDHLLGTTAGKVVNHARCAVLVVHQREQTG